MEITPTKRRLDRLIEDAAEGTMCLPNFQRDFVWRRDEVADLVRSVLRGYFIGSLLLLHSDPRNPPFAPEPVRGAKPPKSPVEPKLLILDGQQRVTSMLYALTAPDLGLKNSKHRGSSSLISMLWSMTLTHMTLSLIVAQMMRSATVSTQAWVSGHNTSFHAQRSSQRRRTRNGTTDSTIGSVTIDRPTTLDSVMNGGINGKRLLIVSGLSKSLLSNSPLSPKATKTRSGASVRSSRNSTRRASRYPSMTY